MNAVQEECLRLALTELTAKSYFDICLVKKMLEITGGVPTHEDWAALELLHCITYTKFSQRLRMEFPNLLRRVLESPSMELNITFKPLSRPLDIPSKLLDN